MHPTFSQALSFWTLGILAALLCSSPFTVADETSEDVEEVITVVATRTERTLDEVAATVTVKSADDIERELARDIADLVRFEPGVTVAGSGRFGLTGFNIRGIGGNRVLTLVDGVRIPEEFTFGPFLSARRDFVDIDSLDRVEIARGPISSLYGSDALGGVVVLTTKEPNDYLRGEQPFYASFKGGWSSVDDSAVGTATFVGKAGAASAMLLYTHRTGEETRNAGKLGGTGADREKPDPQSIKQDNLAVKLSFSPSEAHSFTLGLDDYDNETDTRILSDYGSLVFGTTVNARDAMDSRDRNRWSLGYRYSGDLPFADQMQASVYRQVGKTEQVTVEGRTTPAHAAQSRVRSSFYEQEITGAFVQLGKYFEWGKSGHLVSYGIDWHTNESASMRDGGTFDALGRPVREFSPLPTRDFPLTKATQFAIFAQDEISLLDDRLLVTLGLRFDQFDADATADDVYLDGNPGSPHPEDYKEEEVSAKIGAVYSFSEAFSAYARYGQGFRAPPVDDVNVGFSNFLGGYKTIANPSLSAERCTGLEAGLRLQGGDGGVNWNAQVALFHNDYKNFIESFTLAPQFLRSGGIDPADGLRTFQSINRDAAKIRGWELRGSLAWDAGLHFDAALAQAHGEGETSGQPPQPLNSVDPLSAMLGLGYDAPSGRWGATLLWTLASGKRESDIDPEDPRPASSGYGILDLLVHLRVADRARFELGLFNITNKTYLRWADTAAIGADASARFTQPQFNVGATVRVTL